MSLQEPSILSSSNKLLAGDELVHNWYRFVLSFPPHLVRHYLSELEVTADSCVLDPFCGTGTTIVECKKNGIASVGVESNLLAHFASSTKVDWSPSPEKLLFQSERIADLWRDAMSASTVGEDDLVEGIYRQEEGLETLGAEKFSLLLKDSISPLPLHKAILLRRILEDEAPAKLVPHLRLALARSLVADIGNLHFGPEVGVGPPKDDAPVIESWQASVRSICDGLRAYGSHKGTPARVFREDARQISNVLEPESIDAVITSPPYPNEKDYTRTTRLESVLLGFVETKAELRAMKKGLLRSNTRNVYVEDTDDRWVAENEAIQTLATEIERRRIELGKTSGFERQYARVTKLYFGGMYRHLADLRTALKPGARLAYVVGDQASYFRVMIRTGQILGAIAQQLGYELVSIDLFRTRLATATRAQLREEVVILKWPG
ncbi:DNA methyltransferase [soil metagenome]